MASTNRGPASVQTPNPATVLATVIQQRAASVGLASTDTGIIGTTDATSASMVIGPVPSGWNVMVIQQGAGQITFSGAPNVTIVQPDSQFKTAKQWAAVSFYADAENHIVMGGYTA